MKYFRYGKLLAVLYMILTFGCRTSEGLAGQMSTASENVGRDFDLKNISFLIAENGNIENQTYADDEPDLRAAEYMKIIDRISCPILLDRMIKDSVIKEDLLLDKLLPSAGFSGLRAGDLVFVTANASHSWLSDPDSLTGNTRKLIGTVKSNKWNQDQFSRSFLDPASAGGTRGVFAGILGVSNYFDATHVEYDLMDSTIVNLLPTWYTQNLISFYGWSIFRYQKKTVLWNFFSTRGKDIILLKFMDDHILVAFSYQSSKMVPTPFDYRNNDLLQSPVAIALIKSLFKINASVSRPGHVAEQLKNTLEHSANTPGHLIMMKEVLARARFCDRAGRKSEASQLYELYKKNTNDSELCRYINEPSLAETGYVGDNADIGVPFGLQNPATLQIFAGAQVLATSDYNYSPYQYDNVQIFINKNADSTKSKREETRSFQFNYRFDRISGDRDENAPDSWLNNTKIQYAFSDPADTVYLLEVKIPWSELGCDNYRSHKGLAINLFIGDSDLEENRRKSILSWAVKSGQGWDDPSKFGQIILTAGKHSLTKYLNCLRTSAEPEIDGKADEIWNKCPSEPVNIPYQGNPDAADNSGTFKSMYDNHNLYFLIRVTDNCKNKVGIITTDKCWIEDAATGAIVWKLNGAITAYAPSYYCNCRVRLSAGHYRLRFTSDRGHSFDGWYGPVPRNDIYGASLYFSKN